MSGLSKITEFVNETRREIAKVTWPTRKEVLTTTAMIAVMAILFGVFFLVVDWVMGYVVGKILGMR